MNQPINIILSKKIELSYLFPKTTFTIKGNINCAPKNIKNEIKTSLFSNCLYLLKNKVRLSDNSDNLGVMNC